MPKAVPLLLWPWSTEPWQRIHVDFAEVKGQQFLLVVDSHSKWMEVFPMTSTTANATIVALGALFARYGLPHELVSDNGPQFGAEGELHQAHFITPVSWFNGLAERHVQTFRRMYQSCTDKGTVQHKVADVLFRYRNTPHTNNRQDSCTTVFEDRTQDTPLLCETQFTKVCRKETSCIKIM